MLVTLASEESAQILGLLAAQLFVQGDKQVGNAKIAIVFRDFVFENEVIPKRIPGQIGKDPVILMAVVPIMGKDDVRLELSLELLEIFLDARAFEGEKAIAKMFDDDLLSGDPLQEGPCTGPGFAGATPFRAEHHPYNVHCAAFSGQFEYGSATADFDVVGMRSETEDRTQVFKA